MKNFWENYALPWLIGAGIFGAGFGAAAVLLYLIANNFLYFLLALVILFSIVICWGLGRLVLGK